MSATKRKLVVCCDGTWNLPNQKGKPTNVVKMLRAVRPVDDHGTSQIIHYHPGVGTGNRVDRWAGGMLGVGLTDNVQSAYGFLVDNFSPGDDIYLFGFSRGAYTVRSLAGFIDLVGLLEKIDMSLFVEVFDVYREHSLNPTNKTPDELAAAFLPYVSSHTHERLREVLQRSRKTDIFFVGVWDTVGTLGIPFGPLRWIGRRNYDFHSTELTENVRFAYHALAIDERRKSYPPSIWLRPAQTDGAPTAQIQILEQVWFAGSHSNLGGGYVDAALSDVAFLWMAAMAAAARRTATDQPLALDENYLTKEIQKTMGQLIDSRKPWRWRMRRPISRSVLDPKRAPEGMESCEKIHHSVLLRYECKDKRFEPFPYRPENVVKFLEKPDPSNFADLTNFEKKYGPFNDVPSIGTKDGTPSA